MVADLTIMGNGEVAFAEGTENGRVNAWHHLGSSVQGAMTAEQALSMGYLAGWDVRKQPVFWQNGLGEQESISDRFLTVWTDPTNGDIRPLDVVGRNYVPIQNESLAPFLNALTDESGAMFQTAGAIKNGKQVFLTMKLPDTMLLNGEDPTAFYLIAYNSHDGSSSFRLAVSPVRVVCSNTLAMAMKSATAQWSIRHTRGAEGQIALARESMGLTFAYMAEFQEEAEAMMSNIITDDQFYGIVKGLFPADDDSTTRGANANRDAQDTVMNLWRNSATMTNLDSKSAWRGYNAVTEAIDFYLPVRNTMGDANLARASRSVLPTSPMVALKERASGLLLAV
jgi:phage/plasmid-like protein (TIGR03299 family)